MKNIILFASGNGTNAENICRYFKNDPEIKVAALFCNNPDAKVIERMKPFGIPVHLFTKKELNDEKIFLPLIQKYEPSLIVLAGFLLLVPSYLIKLFPKKIINIHPALLPKFGGKGMHGHHVHEAVLAAGEHVHGITIHVVNEKYDEGKILFQEFFLIEKNDNLESVSKKISELELNYFPEVIKNYLMEE
ncbi:MAG: phosphoribosylglycinamide formyltransferase [Bacteroidia bacterium]